jgi:hypothetical protein
MVDQSLRDLVGYVPDLSKCVSFNPYENEQMENNEMNVIQSGYYSTNLLKLIVPF